MVGEEILDCFEWGVLFWEKCFFLWMKLLVSGEVSCVVLKCVGDGFCCC